MSARGFLRALYWRTYAALGLGALRWRFLWCRTAWATGLRDPGMFLRGVSSDSASWTYRLGARLSRKVAS